MGRAHPPKRWTSGGGRDARGPQGGFTLIEALAAVVLISVGLVATIQCLNAMASGRTRALESEEMQRLAFRKYDELLATDQLPSGSAEGSFEDVGERRFVWRAERSALGTGNLDSVRVQVYRRGEDVRRATEVQGLYCRPAAQGGDQ